MQQDVQPVTWHFPAGDQEDQMLSSLASSIAAEEHNCDQVT